MAESGNKGKGKQRLAEASEHLRNHEQGDPSAKEKGTERLLHEHDIKGNEEAIAERGSRSRGSPSVEDDAASVYYSADDERDGSSAGAAPGSSPIFVPEQIESYPSESVPSRQASDSSLSVKDVSDATPSPLWVRRYNGVDVAQDPQQMSPAQSRTYSSDEVLQSSVPDDSGSGFDWEFVHPSEGRPPPQAQSHATSSGSDSAGGLNWKLVQRSERQRRLLAKRYMPSSGSDSAEREWYAEGVLEEKDE